MKTFLFQGDSITDVGRDRNNCYNLGFGYPNLVASELSYNRPEEFTFINQGISGDRVVSVYNRLNSDILNHKPDYMSILIGVNDVWHGIGGGNGVSDKRYEQVYTMLIEDILEKLPKIKIIILEPFVLKGPATDSSWDAFNSQVRSKAKIAKSVAEKFNLTFVELQNKFDNLCQKAPSTYWLSDGVHPTAAGHEMIAKELIKVI